MPPTAETISRAGFLRLVRNLGISAAVAASPLPDFLPPPERVGKYIVQTGIPALWFENKAYRIDFNEQPIVELAHAIARWHGGSPLQNKMHAFFDKDKLEFHARERTLLEYNLAGTYNPRLLHPKQVHERIDIFDLLLIDLLRQQLGNPIHFRATQDIVTHELLHFIEWQSDPEGQLAHNDKVIKEAVSLVVSRIGEGTVTAGILAQLTKRQTLKALMTGVGALTGLGIATKEIMDYFAVESNTHGPEFNELRLEMKTNTEMQELAAEAIQFEHIT